MQLRRFFKSRHILRWAILGLVACIGMMWYFIYEEFYAPLPPSYFIDKIADRTFGPGSQLIVGNRNPTPMSLAGQAETGDGVFQLIMYNDSTRTAIIYLHDLKAFSAGIVTKGRPSRIDWYFHDADLFTRFTKATAIAPQPSGP